ncbi:hypothetical protein [Paraliomyxa miuraensis]|uniref:hypothetical protein n=1 Tax=Paraliomyxa miuraensis TaxID=376150 RepID=UPI0022579BDC|nr:hypothetical protein [Paraliomyxa miuraensis]MCX4242194.1 hypothetical protein [Paraliomyxa miuraensis]
MKLPKLSKLPKLLVLLGKLLGVVLVLVAMFVAWNWSQLSAFPELPSSYEAKELCSCLFVEGRDQQHCEGFIRQDVVPIDERSYDMEGKAVSVRALWVETRAHYVSPRAGCVID